MNGYVNGETVRLDSWYVDVTALKTAVPRGWIQLVEVRRKSGRHPDIIAVARIQMPAARSGRDRKRLLIVARVCEGRFRRIRHCSVSANGSPECASNAAMTLRHSSIMPVKCSVR